MQYCNAEQEHESSESSRSSGSLGQSSVEHGSMERSLHEFDSHPVRSRCRWLLPQVAEHSPQSDQTDQFGSSDKHASAAQIISSSASPMHPLLIPSPTVPPRHSRIRFWEPPSHVTVHDVHTDHSSQLPKIRQLRVTHHIEYLPHADGLQFVLRVSSSPQLVVSFELSHCRIAVVVPVPQVTEHGVSALHAPHDANVKKNVHLFSIINFV